MTTAPTTPACNDDARRGSHSPSAHGSDTYNPKACCGSHCFAYGQDNGQCWGDVAVIDSMGDDPDGGEYWVHACKGHKEMWDDYGGGMRRYVPETK